MNHTDERYMARCIQLARNGQEGAPPNPMVGAVIVCDGRIIGEGYHRKCGGPHAEVNAFASVNDADRPQIPRSTIYVSLEPCAHYGKTPPCADLIVRQGVRRCVVGCVDPFAQVQGRGIRKLQDAGIDVTVGVLEAECRWLNRRFFTFHRLQRPFITLKWAQTADGFIAVEGRPVTISTPLTQVLCHKRRAEHQAILVGRRTEETDHPSLTVRNWSGPDPRRIVLSHANGPLTEQLHTLWEENVQSILVEGGRQTLQSFIDQGLWDEAYVETSPHTLAELLQLPAGHAFPSEPVAAPVLKEAQEIGCEQVDGQQIQCFLPQNS